MCAWWSSSNPFDNGRVPVTPDDGRPEPPEVTKFSFTRTHAGARLYGGGAASAFTAYSEPTNHSKIETIHTPGKLNTGIPYFYLASGTTKDFLYDTKLFDFLPYEISETEERLVAKSGFDLWLDEELRVATVVRCGFSNVQPLNGVTSSVSFSRESLSVSAYNGYAASTVSLLHADVGSYDSVRIAAIVLYAEYTSKAVPIPDAYTVDTPALAFATGPYTSKALIATKADILALECVTSFMPKELPLQGMVSCAIPLHADMHLIASSRFSKDAATVEALANVQGTALPVKHDNVGFECAIEFPMLLRTASQAAQVLGVLPEVIVSAEYPVAAPDPRNFLSAEVCVGYYGHYGLVSSADILLSEHVTGALPAVQSCTNVVDLLFSAVLESAYPVRFYSADVADTLLLPQAEKFHAPAKLDRTVSAEHAAAGLSLDASDLGFGVLALPCAAVYDQRLSAQPVLVSSVAQLTAEAGFFLPTPMAAHVLDTTHITGNLCTPEYASDAHTAELLFGTVESTYGREYAAAIVSLWAAQSSVLLPEFGQEVSVVAAVTAEDAHTSSNPVQLGHISTVLSARERPLYGDICPAMALVENSIGALGGWNSVAFTADSTLYAAPMSLQDAYTAALFTNRAGYEEHVSVVYSLDDANAQPVLTGSVGWGDEEAYVLDSAYASGTAHIQHVFTKSAFTAPMYRQIGLALYKGNDKYVYKYSYADVRETASHPASSQLVGSYACNQRSYMEFVGLSISGVSCTEHAPRLLSQLNFDYGMCVDTTGQVMVYDGTATGLMGYRSEFSWEGVKFSDILPVTEEENKLRSLLNADFGFCATLPGVMQAAFMIGGCGSKQYDMPWTFPADLLDAYGASLYSADRSPAYHACVYANINEFGKAQADGWSFDALSIAGLEVVRTMAAPAAGLEMYLTTEAPLLITLPCIIQHHSKEYAGSEVLVAYSPDARPSFANVHFASMAAAMPEQVMVYADGSRSALALEALAVFGVGVVFSSPVPFPLNGAAADASGQLLGMAEACNRKEQHWDALYLSALEVCEDDTLRPDFGPHTAVLDDQMLGVSDHRKFTFMAFIAYTVGGLLTGHGSHDGIVVPHRALYPSAVAITLPAVKLAMTSHVSAYATFDAVALFGVSLTEDTICVPKAVFCAPENTGTSYAEQDIRMGAISLSGGYAGGIGDILEMGAADLYYADGLGSSSSVATSVSLTPANENRVVRRRVSSRPLAYDRLWTALLGVGLLYKDYYAMQITPSRPPAWGDDAGVAALSRCFHMPVVSKATTIFGVSATVDYTFADAWLFWKDNVRLMDSAALGVSGPVAIGGQSAVMPGSVADIGYGSAETDLELHGSPWLTSGYAGDYSLNFNSVYRDISSSAHRASEASALLGVYTQGGGGFNFYGALQYVGSSAAVSFGTGINGSPVVAVSGKAPYALWSNATPSWDNLRFDTAAEAVCALAAPELSCTGMLLPGIVQEVESIQHAVLFSALLDPAVVTVAQGDSALYPGVGQILPAIVSNIPVVSDFIGVPAPESAWAVYAAELSAYMTQAHSIVFSGTILTPEVTFWGVPDNGSVSSVHASEDEFAHLSLSTPIAYAGALQFVSGTDITADSTFTVYGQDFVEHGTQSSYALFSNWRTIGAHGGISLALGHMAAFDASTGAVRIAAIAQDVSGSAQGKGMAVALFGPEAVTIGTSAGYSLNAVFFADSEHVYANAAYAAHAPAAISMAASTSFTALEAEVQHCYGAFGYTHIYGPDNLTVARAYGYTVAANPAAFGSAGSYFDCATPVYAVASSLSLSESMSLPGAEAAACHAQSYPLWAAGPYTAMHTVDEVVVNLSLSPATSGEGALAEVGSTNGQSELQILGYDYLSGTAQYDLLFNSGQRADGLSEASGIAALLSVGEPAMELPGSEQAVVYFAGMPIVPMAAEVQELTGMQLAALTSEFSTGLDAAIQETHALFSSADPYAVVYSETYAADDGLFGIVACGTGGPEFFGAIADEGTNAEYVVPYGPPKPSGDGQRVKNRLLYRWYPTSGAKVSLVYKGFPYRDGTIPQDAGNVVHPGNGMGVSGFVPMETVPLNLYRLGGPILKAADIDGVRAATDYNYLDFYDFSWKHPVTSAPYAVASLHAEASGATAITLPGHIMYVGSSAPEAHMGILGSPILSAGGTGDYTMALYATAGGIGSAQQAAWVADADIATYVPGYGSFTFSAAIQEVGYSSSAISSLAIYGSQELSIAGSDAYALWRQGGMDWNNVRFDSAPYAALDMHGTLGAASGTLPLLAAESVTAYALHSADAKLSVSGYDALSPGGMSAYGLRLPAGGDFFAAAAQSSNANWVISEQLVLPADMLSRRSSFYADEAVTLNAYTPMAAMDMARADVSLVSALTADLSSDVAADFMLASVWHSPAGIADLRLPTPSSSTDVALSEQTVLTASFAISVPAAILAGDIGVAPASTMRMSISGDSALSIGGMSEYAMSLFWFSYDTPHAQMLDDVRTGVMSLSPAMSFEGAEQQVGWGSGLDALRILVSSEVCVGGSVPASLYYGISSKVVADMAGYTVESVPALFSLAVSSPLLRAETANEDEGITKAARERLVSQAVIELTDAQAASFGSASAYLERAVPVYAAESLLTLRAGVILPGAEVEAYHATGANLWSSGPVSAIHSIDEVTVLLSLSAAVSSAASVAEMGSSSSASELQILGYDYLSGTAPYALLFASEARADNLSVASGEAARLSAGAPALDLPGSEQAVLYFSGIPVVPARAEVRELSSIQVAEFTVEFSTHLQAAIQEVPALYDARVDYSTVYGGVRAADDSIFGMPSCGTGGPEFFGVIADEGSNAEYVVPSGPANPGGDNQRLKRRLLYRWYPTSGVKVSLVYKGFPYQYGTIPQDAGNVDHPGNGMGVSGFVPIETVPLNLHRIGSPLLSAASIDGLHAAVDYNYQDFYDFAWESPANSAPYAVGALSAEPSFGASVTLPGHILMSETSAPEAHMAIYGSEVLSSGGAGAYNLRIFDATAALSSAQTATWSAYAAIASYTPGEGGFVFSGAIQDVGYSFSSVSGMGIYGSSELAIDGSAPYALWRQAGREWDNTRFDVQPYAALDMHGTLGAAAGTLPLMAAESVVFYALHSADAKLDVRGYDALAPGGASGYGLRLPMGGLFYAAATQLGHAVWVTADQYSAPADMLANRSSFVADEAVTFNAYTATAAYVAVNGVSTVDAITAELSSTVSSDFLFGTVWRSPVSTTEWAIPSASGYVSAVTPISAELTTSFAISVPAAILAGDIGVAPASTMSLSLSGASLLTSGGIAPYALNLLGFVYDTPRAQMLDTVLIAQVSMSPAMGFFGSEQQVAWGTGLDSMRIVVSPEVCAGGSVPALLYFGTSGQFITDLSGYAEEHISASFSMAASSPELAATEANFDEGITKAARERLISSAIVELTDALAAAFSGSTAISFSGSLYADYTAVTAYAENTLYSTFSAHVVLAEQTELGFSPAMSLPAVLPEGYADIASSGVHITIDGSDVLYASGMYTITAAGSHNLDSAGYAPMVAAPEHGYASMHDLSPAITFGAVETSVDVAGIDILNQCYAHIVGAAGIVIGGSSAYGLYGGIVSLTGENYSAVTIYAATGTLNLDTGSPYLGAAESAVVSTHTGASPWVYREVAHEIPLVVAEFYADTASVSFRAVEAPTVAMDEYAAPAPGRKPSYFIFSSGQYVYAEQSGAWLKTPYSVYKGSYSGKMHFSDGIAYECSQLAAIYNCAHQTGSAWAVSVAQDAYMGAVDHNRADAYVYWDIGRLSATAHALDIAPAPSLFLEPQLVLPGTELSALPTITGQAIPHGRILGSDVLSIPGQGTYTITLTEDAVFGPLPPNLMPGTETVVQTMGSLNMWASYVSRETDIADSIVHSNSATVMQSAAYGDSIFADESLIVHNCSGRHYSDSPELRGTFWVSGVAVAAPAPDFVFTSFAVYDEHPAGCQIFDSRVALDAIVYEPGISVSAAFAPEHHEAVVHRVEDVVCVVACGANKPGSVLLHGALTEPVYSYAELLGYITAKVTHDVSIEVPFLACGAVGGPLLIGSVGFSDGVAAYEACWRELPVTVNVVVETGVLTGGCPPEFSYVMLPAFAMDIPSVAHAHGHRETEALLAHTVLELPVISCRNASSVSARAGAVQEIVNIEYGILPPALRNNAAFEITHTAVLTDLMTAQCFCRVHAYYPGYLLDVSPVTSEQPVLILFLHVSGATVLADQLDPYFCTGRLFDNHPFGCHTTGDALGGLFASVPDTGASEYEKATAYIVTQDTAPATGFGSAQSFYGLEVALGVTTSVSLLASIKQETHVVDMGFSLCLSARTFWHCGMYAVALNAVIPTWIVPRLMFIPVVPDLELWFDYEEDSPFKLSFIF